MFIFREKRTIASLKEALHNEQIARQQKVFRNFGLYLIEIFFIQEEEMKELRNEVTKLKADFEQRWSSQIKMVKINYKIIRRKLFL